jgi:CRP/FNR family transcriptional regulator, dissimilatory nitrate respiration regulator
MLDVRTLRRIPALSALAPPAQRELLARGIERRYAAQQTLFRAGQPPPGLFLVVEGRVRVVREGAARRQVVHTEGPGATLGEVPLFDGGGMPATAVALVPTRCLIFTLDTVVAAIRQDPRLALLLLGQLSRRVRQLVTRIDRLSFQGVRARLADYLLGRSSAATGQAVAFEGTQTALAEELGTVREVLVRELRYLRRQGLIRASGRGGYQVLDSGALRRLVTGLT